LGGVGGTAGEGGYAHVDVAWVWCGYGCGLLFARSVLVVVWEALNASQSGLWSCLEKERKGERQGGTVFLTNIKWLQKAVDEMRVGRGKGMVLWLIWLLQSGDMAVEM
jgi:hypothetical protein